MSFFDAEKSGTLSNNDISWRGNSALTDAINGSSLAGGFYDGANGILPTNCFVVSLLGGTIFCFFLQTVLGTLHV